MATLGVMPRMNVSLPDVRCSSWFWVLCPGCSPLLLAERLDEAAGSPTRSQYDNPLLSSASCLMAVPHNGHPSWLAVPTCSALQQGCNHCETSPETPVRQPASGKKAPAGLETPEDAWLMH